MPERTETTTHNRSKRVPRQAAVIEQLPHRGGRLSTFGWIALTLGSGCLGLRYGAGPAGAAWGWLAAGAVLVVAGVWAVLRGRRHLTPVLTSLRGLSADERIVVFLRSFKDDKGFSRVAARRWFRLLFTSMLPTPAHLRTEEDQVGRAFSPFGRMIALGNTKDQLPRLGAARHYASDGTWWDEVCAALDRSALVVLAAGAGKSLAREVKELVRRGNPTRLVLLVVHDRKQYADFRASLGGEFPKGLPDYPPTRMRHRLLRGRYVRAAVYFDSDWTPHWEMLDGRYPVSGLARRTQRALPRALRTVYRRAGVPARVTSRTPRPRAVKLSVLMIAAFWLTVLALPVLGVAFVKAVAGALATDNPLDPSSYRDTPSGSFHHVTGEIDTGAFYSLYASWPLWLLAAAVATFGYRMWRGGPYAIMMVRIQGIFLPVFLLTSLMAQLPAVGRLLFLALGLGVLVALCPPVAALLLFRREVHTWVDSRL